MSKKKNRQRYQASQNQKPQLRSFGVAVADWDDILCSGYTSLADCPEVMTACHTIAEQIASMTIHLMANTESGDIRITNQLSRKIDIDPMPTMTRKEWMEAIVMTLLLYGKGNAVVAPHTYEGILQSLEPIGYQRVTFEAQGYRDYKVVIDGRQRDPASVLHFTYNPDPVYLWKGRGMVASLRDVADSLKQASETEKGFMQSKWKPSVIVKVDALIDEFSSPAGRKKLVDSYLQTSSVGEPWIIPAEQFQVEQIKPLSLADLAINDTVQLDRRKVAAILGVPPFVVGVGDYNQQAWNNFVQNKIRPIAMGIQQELTKKLILSEKWYLRFNTWSLMDYDLATLASVFGQMYDRGFVTGNEARDRIGMEPMKGLDELHILENYVPVDMIGKQNKLNGGNN